MRPVAGFGSLPPPELVVCWRLPNPLLRYRYLIINQNGIGVVLGRSHCLHPAALAAT